MNRLLKKTKTRRQKSPKLKENKLIATEVNVSKEYAIFGGRQHEYETTGKERNHPSFINKTSSIDSYQVFIFTRLQVHPYYDHSNLKSAKASTKFYFIFLHSREFTVDGQEKLCFTSG